MKHTKGPPQARKIWRMTEAVPQGEFVAVGGPVAPVIVQPDAAAVAAKPMASAEPRGNWLESSFELLRGTEVNDGPDTVPDDLFDQLFAPSLDPVSGSSDRPKNKS